MKQLFFLVFLFGLRLPAAARHVENTPGSLPDGILKTIRNGTLTEIGDHWEVVPADAREPVELAFTHSEAIGVHRQNAQWWVLPLPAPSASTPLTHVPPAITPVTSIHANQALWVLPLEPDSGDHAWHVELQGGDLIASTTADSLRVVAKTRHLTLRQAEARPHSDVFGHRFAINLVDAPGDVTKHTASANQSDALAAFTWGTILPSVVEKTMAAHFRYRSGYVLSTLETQAYAGSYPAVDHEFQIKGRLALGSALDLDVVRRIIELQFQLMHDDPEQLSRAPTSVQPDGSREYHIRRNSADGKENAAMFLLTGNIEVLDESWGYYIATKDRRWLQTHIGELERAAAWTQASVDEYGRVWSDVYYEDQVIKDGRVTQAQCFAAASFSLLARMELLLGRSQQAAFYRKLATRLAAALIRPLPAGYWDDTHHRFIDWVDRNGAVHDHLHLLANALPVTFGYATPTQAAAVRELIDANRAEFERFPTFLSADIAGYTQSEIGSGGPYDLSAAGRYWFWDAAYQEAQGNNHLLHTQLDAVAAEAAANGFFMGERYDMDHVFYIDGKHAHGAEKYYEYPVVYAAVLLSRYLGLNSTPDADVALSPHLDTFGSVEFTGPQYALRYRYDPSGFTLTNLADKPRRYAVDLSALTFASSGSASSHLRLTTGSSARVVSGRTTLFLPPHAEAHWGPLP